MPLEISEIGVHIAVGHTPQQARTPSRTDEQSEPMTPARVEAIVQQCVQDVLRDLRLREGR
ncbi:MAG: DUF5908 family protein [Novosphingobium sp.]